jgi:hypothetical protein
MLFEISITSRFERFQPLKAFFSNPWFFKAGFIRKKALKNLLKPFYIDDFFRIHGIGF